MHIRTMIPNQAKNISSPHGRADSASDRACTSTDNCARRPGDEETTSAAEASSSQNRAATDRHRGDNSEHQLHGCFPREEDYRSQPLTVGESRRARRHALERPAAKLEGWRTPAEHLCPHLCIEVRAAANDANEIDTDLGIWCGREESNLHGLCPQRPQRCASTYSATTAWEFPGAYPGIWLKSAPRQVSFAGKGCISKHGAHVQGAAESARFGPYRRP